MADRRGRAAGAPKVTQDARFIHHVIFHVEPEAAIPRQNVEYHLRALPCVCVDHLGVSGVGSRRMEIAGRGVKRSRSDAPSGAWTRILGLNEFGQGS